jgi:TPR repeat protein
VGRRTVWLLAAALLTAAPAFPQLPGRAALDPAAAEARGLDHLYGRGVARDPALAAFWLEQAADAGRPYAAAGLGELYLRGSGVPADVVRARELTLRAAQAGIAPAQTSLGMLYAFPPQGAGIERDLAAAVQWLNAAAEQEDPRALGMLGVLYRTGTGVVQHRDTWVLLATRAAELGFAPSAVEIALHLLAGDPAAADVERALHFLRGAASSGYSLGAYALGKEYLRGEHISRNAGLAAEWLTRASELGFSLGTAWLAELYAKGIGVTANPRRAAELRAQALAAMSLGERNELAWELAVSPHAELRNGTLAVEIAEAAVAERPLPLYIDTLAAAYAETGRFEEAVRAEQRALAALSGDAAAKTRDSYAARLELYRSGGVYRESP